MHSEQSTSSKYDFLVVSDLDGTLLDHHTYSWEAARPSISLLQEKNVPIVINTSKTAEEVSKLQKELKVDESFIVENGSALYLTSRYLEKYNFSETNIRQLASKSNLPVERIGKYFLIVFGKKYQEITHCIRHIKQKNDFKFEGYSDWNIETIIEHTGLSHEDAQFSKNRAYSEPIIWSDTNNNKQTFIQQVHDRGLMHLQGGRFLHVLGNTNKAKPMIFLKSLFEMALNKSIKIIALGDSANDIAMLEAAELPVCIRSPKSKKLILNPSKNPLYTKHYGPQGWHEAITTLINRNL